MTAKLPDEAGRDDAPLSMTCAARIQSGAGRRARDSRHAICCLFPRGSSRS